RLGRREGDLLAVGVESHVLNKLCFNSFHFYFTRLTFIGEARPQLGGSAGVGRFSLQIKEIAHVWRSERPVPPRQYVTRQCPQVLNFATLKVEQLCFDIG